MKTATGGKTSVPQIFFNKEYVGGNRELQDIISAADQEKWSSLLQEVKQNMNQRCFDPLKYFLIITFLPIDLPSMQF